MSHLPATTHRFTLLTALLVLLPGSAQAYDLEKDGSGAEVSFAGASLHLYVDGASRDLSSGDVLGAAQRAAAHWTGAAPVSVTVEAEASHGQPGYDREHPEQNRSEVFFVDDEWELDEGVVATTLVTMDTATHTIIDADILINGAQHRFAVLPDSSQGGQGLRYDLENALTHELGHALGLAHNPGAPNATMFNDSQRGEIKKRHLSDDDVAGVQALYTAAQAASSKAGVGCSSAPGASSGWALVLMMVALLSRLGRRSRSWAVATLGAGALALAAPAQAQPPSGGAEPGARAERRVEVVAEGTVRSAEAYAKGNRIYTRLTVTVERCPWGSCPAELAFEVPGGTLGRYEQRLADRAVPRTGERISVALARKPSGDLHPVGLVSLARPAAPAARRAP